MHERGKHRLVARRVGLQHLHIPVMPVVGHCAFGLEADRRNSERRAPFHFRAIVVPIRGIVHYGTSVVGMHHSGIRPQGVGKRSINQSRPPVVGGNRPACALCNPKFFRLHQHRLVAAVLVGSSLRQRCKLGVTSRAGSHRLLAGSRQTSQKPDSNRRNRIPKNFHQD